MQCKVLIDLGFDCNSETEEPIDIAKSAMQKIKNFLEGEGAPEPAERFGSLDSSLYVNILIPVADIDAGKILETKLDNNLGQFPPLLNNFRRFNYLSEPDPIDEE